MSGDLRLRLEIHGSLTLTLLSVAMHAAAAAAVLIVLPPAPALSAAILLAALAAVVTRERTLLRAPDSPAALEMSPDGGLVLQQRDGTRLPGLASSRRYVSRWLVVLVLERPDGGKRTLLVARDMLGAEGFRRLRLWALWNAHPASRGAAGA